MDQDNMEAPPGFEPGMEVLQTSALPLGYGAAVCLARGFGGRRSREKLERETGFEPATSTLARSHSTTELFPPVRRIPAALLPGFTVSEAVMVPHGRNTGQDGTRALGSDEDGAGERSRRQNGPRMWMISDRILPGFRGLWSAREAWVVTCSARRFVCPVVLRSNQLSG